MIEFCVSIPVEDRYDVPAGAATVGARRAIGPRLDVTADATLAFGRTDTSSLWVDYIPELDYMEGPRRHTVRTLRAGVGLAYRF